MSPPITVDVLVVGSGPAGATTARFAAQGGLDVLLVDKKQELGAPIQCSGAVSAHALMDVGVEAHPEFVVEPIYGFKVYDSDGASTVLDYRELKPDAYADNPLGYIVDRRRFDRYLTTLVERSGAEVLLKTEAQAMERIDDRRIRVQLQHFGAPLTVHARVLVGADGLQSQVGKWAGLRTHIKLSELASCLQYVMDGVQTEGLLELITGRRWAPGGYAWVFPKSSGYAEVGLGIIRTMTDHDARWHLDHFLKRSFLAERFRLGKIIEIQGGGVPLAAPLTQQTADHVLLVGDAARHVNPITGGGIHTALRCGKIAGDFLANFLRSGAIPSNANLQEFQRRWEVSLGRSMWKLYRSKRAVFRIKEFAAQDRQLYRTLADYFGQDSEYRKI